MDLTTVAELCGVDPDCDHETLIHLADSPLWICADCEGQLNLATWHELKARS